MFHAPSYDGRGLVNLIAEIEHRMTGSSVMPRLAGDLAAQIPDGDSYVLVLFDGLGDAQLSHPAAAGLDRHRSDHIDAPFPTTTTVSLACVATGLTPARHGIIGHHMWWPEVEAVLNVLKWIHPGGEPAGVDTRGVLPGPNLWERLSAAGCEPITVQPGGFESSPLSVALYRGARFESAWSERDLVEATLDLAARPRRFVFTYLPHVDVAAHLFGQTSPQYRNALTLAATAWERLCHRLPQGATLVGTADHGHVDYGAHDKWLVERHPEVEFFGDPRALYVRGEPAAAAQLAADLPARWVDAGTVTRWLGTGDGHPELPERLPAGALMADRGNILIPGNMDRRLIGYHGGLTDDERRIPLLIG